MLGTRSVDAGGGWLIFALPPAELYLMTDDVAATVAALQAEGIGSPGRSVTRAGAC